jgi:hypothetical protein
MPAECLVGLAIFVGLLGTIGLVSYRSTKKEEECRKSSFTKIKYDKEQLKEQLA